MSPDVLSQSSACLFRTPPVIERLESRLPNSCEPLQVTRAPARSQKERKTRARIYIYGWYIKHRQHWQLQGLSRSPENVSSRRDARGEVTCRVTEGHRGDHHTCGTYIYGINRIKWLYMIDGMVGALYGERVIASISGTDRPQRGV